MKNIPKLIKVMSIVGLSIGVLAGCNSQVTTQLEEQITTLQQENNTLKQENTDLQQKVKQLEASLEEALKVEDTTFTIYTADNLTLERKEQTSVTVKGDAPLQEALEAIAEVVSVEAFEGLPIEVMEIEEVQGKKVATINLEEDQTKQVSWNTNYFQGSTGATMTRIALVESFLQKEYRGEWIDGVLFLYQNEEITFDHLTLNGIVYE